MTLAVTTGDLLGVLPATGDVRLTPGACPHYQLSSCGTPSRRWPTGAEKALRDPPPGFEAFRAAPQSRPALAIVAHMGDLMEWGERMALDGILAARGTESVPVEVIIQGPIADALTHVCHLAMMRGMAAAPVRPESYASARIAIGRVGRDQDTERREFDGQS